MNLLYVQKCIIVNVRFSNSKNNSTQIENIKPTAQSFMQLFFIISFIQSTSDITNFRELRKKFVISRVCVTSKFIMSKP